jgi:GTP-binding protein
LKITAEFITSAAGPEGFSREGLPEVAMVGRSNVGKSTLINALVRKSVARTSAAPGKTRLVNFYRVKAEGRPEFLLVDLPGYGYARGGGEAAREFGELTGAYFASRLATGRLVGAFQLVDARHPGLDSDRHAWAWLAEIGAPRHVVATKLDKLTRAERTRLIRELATIHDAPAVLVSAPSGEGLNELWTLIARLLKQPPQPPLPDPTRT